MLKTKRSFVTPLLFLFITLIFSVRTYSQVQIGQDLEGDSTRNELGSSVSMPDPFTVAVGAPYNDGSTASSGYVKIYTRIDSIWTQKGRNIYGEFLGDFSGTSVSMPDSNTVGIGSPFNDDNGFQSGHVRIFRWIDTSWVKKGNNLPGEMAHDNSGQSISMPDSNTIAIGAYGNDGNGNQSGHVRIYVWRDSIWQQKGVDIDGESANDGSGRAVSMPDSNTVAIGAISNRANGSYSGHVRVYRWSGGNWIQKGNDIDGEAAGDLSGVSVSMPDSNTVAIGATQNFGSRNDAGNARIFTWNGTDWVQKGINLNGERAGDKFGVAVSMPDANTIAIGASLNDSRNRYDAGRVYVYRWYRDRWVNVGDDLDGQNYKDEFGNSVSMPDANHVAIGAHNNDGVVTKYRAGHVRVFSLCNIASSVDVQACTSFKSFSGNYIWDTSGVYTDTVIGYANCTNVIEVNLTIDTVDITLSQHFSTLSSNAAGASYQWLDCNNGMTILQGDTNQSFTPSVNGSYAVQVAQNGCVDTSVCITINNVGLDESNFKNGISMYPNPSNGYIIIDLGEMFNNTEVIIRNVIGQKVSSYEFENIDKLEVLIPGDKGFYFLEVKADNKTSVLKVLKE